jgi:hypothetical protein
VNTSIPLHKHYKKTITHKDMGGNRGLNTQHVIDGIGTRCDKTKPMENEKWISDD